MLLLTAFGYLHCFALCLWCAFVSVSYVFCLPRLCLFVEWKGCVCLSSGNAFSFEVRHTMSHVVCSSLWMLIVIWEINKSVLLGFMFLRCFSVSNALLLGVVAGFSAGVTVTTGPTFLRLPSC